MTLSMGETFVGISTLRRVTTQISVGGWIRRGR
jgi:hypothetical protein